MKKSTRIFLLLIIISVILVGLASCNSQQPILETGIDSTPNSVIIEGLDIEGIAHNPTGLNNLYGKKEVEPIVFERVPRDPCEGDQIMIKAVTWPVNDEVELWLEWQLNGIPQPNIIGKHTMNLDKKALWEAKLGSFKQGDWINYTVHAGKEGVSVKATEIFEFAVLDWDNVKSAESFINKGNRVELELNSESKMLKPVIAISFQEDGSIRLQFEPFGSENFAGGSQDYTITESEEGKITIKGQKSTITITKDPYYMEILNNDGTLLMKDYKPAEGLRLLTDGRSTVLKIQHNLYAHENEPYYGFGMKYDDLNHRGKNVDIYCVNWYTEQDGETYVPVPFFVVPNKYGLYVNSTYYAQFRLATDAPDKTSIDVYTGGDVNTGDDIYLFMGENEDISMSYSKIVGRPVLPPVWAFGPWISANEWDKQSEVMEQIEKSLELDIPTSAIVLEAWSDEETFYTFNDSVFTPKTSDWVPQLSDFTFGGRWPDPKGMVDYAHDNKIKVLLWQIPVLKKSDHATAQSLLDQKYAEKMKYVIRNENGQSYRMPPGWFGQSLLVDFTSKTATDWFLSKRKYLLDEIGIDGFKTDGGEFVWGRDSIASDGRQGDELRNTYPDLYAQAFFEFARTIKTDAITFSRAGGAYMGQHPITWAGDQCSTFEAYMSAVRATQSASLSGIPFIAWDIAGFSGDRPSAQLYKRSVAQAAFSPIMQVHSEWSGDPEPSAARTPWNMAQRTGDDECLSVYKKFANMRMSLLPYLYNEARHTSLTGIPLMRSMAYEFPEDSRGALYEFQYMLGGSILVAPIVKPDVEEWKVYLPDGKWFELNTGKYLSGGTEITCSAHMNEIPIFIRAGSIIPFNLNTLYDFGGSIGNNVDRYNTLTFSIHPNGLSTYNWFDYTISKEFKIDVIEEFNKNNHTIKISVPEMKIPVSLQIYSHKPEQVIFDGVVLKAVSDIGLLQTQLRDGWVYDKDTKSIIIKLNKTDGSDVIISN